MTKDEAQTILKSYIEKLNISGEMHCFKEDSFFFFFSVGDYAFGVIKENGYLRPLPQ